jgi:hypothetical protein
MSTLHDQLADAYTELGELAEVYIEFRAKGRSTTEVDKALTEVIRVTRNLERKIAKTLKARPQTPSSPETAVAHETSKTPGIDAPEPQSSTETPD